MGLPAEVYTIIAVVGGAVAFCALLFLVFRRRVFAATSLFEEEEERKRDQAAAEERAAALPPRPCRRAQGQQGPAAGCPRTPRTPSPPLPSHLRQQRWPSKEADDESLATAIESQAAADGGGGGPAAEATLHASLASLPPRADTGDPLPPGSAGGQMTPPARYSAGPHRTRGLSWRSQSPLSGGTPGAIARRQPTGDMSDIDLNTSYPGSAHPPHHAVANATGRWNQSIRSMTGGGCGSPARPSPLCPVQNEVELLCQNELPFDWGPGWKKCAMCGKKPIYNRGCQRCQLRMCEVCFMWHRVCPPGVRPMGDPRSPASPQLHPRGDFTLPNLSVGRDPRTPSVPPPDMDELVVPDDLALGDGVRTKPKNGQPWGAYRLCRDFQMLRPPVAQARPAGRGTEAEEAEYCAASLDWLRQGGTLTYFTFLRGTSSRQSDLDLSARIFSLSAFEDETQPPPTGISVPRIDVSLLSHRAKYTFCINKAMYCIAPSPKWGWEDITPQLVASHYYAACCMPPGTDVVPVKDERKDGMCWFPNQFRIKKPIIPYIFKFNIQFRVTEMCPELCRDLAPVMCDGLRIDRGFLLERTKRNPGNTDMIAKAKSLLLYHRLAGGGMIVTMPTTAVASSLPAVISRIIDTLSFLSCKDVVLTTQMARQFYAEKMYKDCAINPPKGFMPNTQQEGILVLGPSGEPILSPRL